MSGPWLSVVGIGEDGLDGLSAAARVLIGQADILAGGERHLAMIPPGPAERLVWAAPFEQTLVRLAEFPDRRVCVLASGDPMWFGIGATLARRFGGDRMVVLPHPGAFSLAASRLAWPLHETTCLSVHGRPLAALALHVQPRRRLLVLSEDGSSPSNLAGMLRAEGYGASRLTVFERLGGPEERRVDGLAAEWSADRLADLNTVAIEVIADRGASRPRSTAPGLPDEAYLHDGQLTKREIRAATLAALAPWPGARLWDVGAGCGSIAIEWCRAGGTAVAIERDPKRVDLIGRNAARLGVPQLAVQIGEALAVLAGLEPSPDAVFIGGGASSPGLLDACWSALPAGGRLVANAVTAQAEAALLAWHGRHGGDMVRLSVSRLSPTGRFHTWHPLMPVTQYTGVKP